MTMVNVVHALNRVKEIVGLNHVKVIVGRKQVAIGPVHQCRVAKVCVRPVFQADSRAASVRAVRSRARRQLMSDLRTWNGSWTKFWAKFDN
jgi:hypothetical protein